MSDSLRMREILRQRFHELHGEVYIWLPTAAGPQLADIMDIQGTIDLHLFVEPNPKGVMWNHTPPPPIDPSSDAMDAARYRFLRDSPHFNVDRGRLEWYLPRWYSGKGSVAERLDQSVDQAIKEKK